MAEKIVMFGDSLTFGYGVYAKDNITTLIEQKTGIPTINSGLNGDTTRNALKRLAKDVLVHNADIVTLLFGSNDCAPSDFYYVTPFEFEQNMRKIIESIEYSNPKAQVVLITIPPVDDTVFMPYTTNSRIVPYNDIIRKIAEEKYLPLCDLSAHLLFVSGGNTDEYLQEDGSHLTEKAYLAFCDCLYDTIKNLI